MTLRSEREREREGAAEKEKGQLILSQGSFSPERLKRLFFGAGLLIQLSAVSES